MGLTVIDAMLRGGSISLFLLLTLLFARNAPSSLAARLGVGLAFGGACYVALLALDRVLSLSDRPGCSSASVLPKRNTHAEPEL